MKYTIELEAQDIKELRGVMFDIREDSEHLTDEQILMFWESLPELIRLDAVKWGINDTEVRDEIYEHFTSLT